MLVATEGEMPGQYSLVLCDTIGTNLDSIHIRFLPELIAFTSTHVLSTCGNVVHVWNYTTDEVCELHQVVRLQ
jgi:hypothetical protein